ncbi:MAG: hypothetical protein LQ342_005897 [Letrouitia transgressa]|nr:MAG: hypothetical protein LQ342_005897 [Letrouitia transgressa]
MNSLNLLSTRVIGQNSPERPPNYRRRSFSEGNLSSVSEKSPPRRSVSQHVKRESSSETLREKETPESDVEAEKAAGLVTPLTELDFDEHSPLLETTKDPSEPDSKGDKSFVVARKFVEAIFQSFQALLSSVAAPGAFLVAFLCDDHGNFSPFWHIRKICRNLLNKIRGKSTTHAVGLVTAAREAETDKTPATLNEGDHNIASTKLRPKGLELTNALTSGSSKQGRSATKSAPNPQTDQKSGVSSSSDETTPARRSIRIRLYNEDTGRRRKSKKVNATNTNSDPKISRNDQEPILTVASIKSPTSPASSLRMTKYPRAPAPPRPLIPLRQPSYSAYTSTRLASRLSQKTLIIDLDETLIHSLAKGGRMSTGHMVEVKLNTAIGFGGTTLGPQHPILYYVHKRPHCDEFLRKVCKWYNLVVFTASVQEYADPVINWLEQERKYFAARYYRQHCTFRNGVYIKDLSSVEPDLSRVMILDNSPLSYIFHEDNAIPIEGWINDPTDNDLLHLIPLLEALQYVTDVRALLALRRGES